MMSFKTWLSTAVGLLCMVQVMAQCNLIVLDGVFDDWAAIEGLEDSVTEALRVRSSLQIMLEPTTCHTSGFA